MNSETKRRIGILTIHSAVNYGSVLQAYALQKHLEADANGDTVELIDYQPPCIMDGYSLNPLKNLSNPKRFLKYCVTFHDRKIRNRAFREFTRDCLHLSAKTYTNSQQLSRDCANWNVFVLGSDQVWNPEIVKDDRAFWLEFAKTGYKATFSSSFGTTKVPESYRKALICALNGFQKIAVREPSAADILSGVTQPVAVTCDPVFLLSAGQWEALARKPKDVPDHYILLYTVERNEKLEELVREAAAYYGIPVVDLGARSNPREYIGVHSPAYGPREFLYLIRHANYMATNSFHGTAFSIIFNKRCIGMLHHSRGTRIRELAELAGRSRFILPEDASLSDVTRLFTETNETENTLLNNRIAASGIYLQNILEEARLLQGGGTNEEY